ncbi:tetratricopeptide repeat protein [Andreprevotia chitinilytica]|uniref:tetratricopeptide repeat protein n=1 Tax=Andreprevotia chitinilytica TaxID=396808 RepID=UPI000553766D|nr:tetratricopeptide repeat protein [Andreprevotia chitinilytica]
MFRSARALVLITLCSATLCLAAPSEQQVKDAVSKGDYQHAQTMMQEAVSAHPESAKAHYIYAEILAHNGQMGQAATEAAKAKQIDPQIHFTNPEKFGQFEALLAAAQHRNNAPAQVVRAPDEQAHSSGFPIWLVIALLVGGAILLAVIFNRRNNATVMPVGGGMGGGYSGGGYSGYAGGGGGGTTIINNGSGGSGAGAAIAGAAGGFAAGMLVEEMLDHRRNESSYAQPPRYTEAPNAPAGNDYATQQLETQPVDFGNGPDWGSNDSSSDSGGGVDMGNNDSW